MNPWLLHEVMDAIGEYGLESLKWLNRGIWFSAGIVLMLSVIRWVVR